MKKQFYRKTRGMLALLLGLGILLTGCGASKAAAPAVSQAASVEVSTEPQTFGGTAAATAQPEPTAAAVQTVQQSALEASAEAPAEGKNASVNISFAGDCTFASYYGANYSRTFEKYYEDNGPDYFFQNVLDIFKADDLTVVNLEGTFTTSTERVYKTWNFKADPSYVNILTRSSIECVNTANNHSHDYSESGYEETIETLDKAGIAWFGQEDTCMLEINGIQIGFSGIYECEEGLGCQDQAVENVEKLKEEGAEIIICEFHWGDENSYSPNSSAITLAHAVVDAGADLVIGHHPHVLQGIEVYNGKYICYSMGNFCFGGNPGVQDKDTMIFQTTFEIVNGELQPNAEYNIIPCSISTDSSKNTYCPTPATGDEADRILEKIYSMSEKLDGGLSGSVENIDYDEIKSVKGN